MNENIPILGEGKEERFCVKGRGIFKKLVKYFTEPCCVLRGDCIEIYENIEEKTQSELADLVDHSSSYVNDRISEMVDANILSKETIGEGGVQKMHKYEREIPLSDVIKPSKYFLIDLYYLNILILTISFVSVVVERFTNLLSPSIYPIILLVSNTLLVVYIRYLIRG